MPIKITKIVKFLRRLKCAKKVNIYKIIKKPKFGSALDRLLARQWLRELTLG